jgi:hypothetical protein
MKTDDRIQTLETITDGDYTIDPGAVGIVRVPNIIDGKSSVQFGSVVVLCAPGQVKRLDIGSQLTPDDIEAVYKVRLSDLRERYLGELRRYAAAAQTLKRQRNEALARLNGSDNGTKAETE